MTSKPPHLAWLSHGDVSRLSKELVEAERYSQLRWRATSDERRDAILVLVREAMLRLLADPVWVPGSIGLMTGGRLDVTFTVDLSDWEIETATARVMQDDKVVADLLALAECLDETITDSP